MTVLIPDTPLQHFHLMHDAVPLPDQDGSMAA